jgi:glutamate/tyrosine decarboxylase-like PLP-dependent enzyme
MSDPVSERNDFAEILDFVVREAKDYLSTLDSEPARKGDVEGAAARLVAPLPEDGKGALEALSTLLEEGLDASVRSSGPRFFHFVIGGVTPAALGADWITSVLDQNPGLWAATPLGAQLEDISLAWLRDLFQLPAEWGGVLTSGATMANYVGLGAARGWWAHQQGVDINESGFGDLPPVPVFSSGYVHASVSKALGMLGIGRTNLKQLAADDTGRLDVDALEAALRDLKGAPAIISASAGEVNAGQFDPLEKMADLAERYNAWLHVDGAFGLFARLSPRTSKLAQGVERAHSVTADGHKWLNIPYDCGFAFVRDNSWLQGLFGLNAPYLTGMEDPHPNYGFLGPESSQRARGLTVWATLRAYGRSGYRAMVERHLDLAQRVATRVDAASDLELLSDVALNIVCFRWHPEGVNEEQLDDLNTKLGAAILEDGRVYVGTTVYRGHVAFRPAIVNWRTTEKDVDLLVDVVRELGSKLTTP